VGDSRGKVWYVVVPCTCPSTTSLPIVPFRPWPLLSTSTVDPAGSDIW